ncbi:MAG TPA: methylated-DNA--[protein]-cysteine S-methyltransferase [Thermoanaerobaculia bacterium]|nr:methylated-DNA--[protein]-cysteine S-methyltransferase [Thermoanaerobaculia bacterium]
MRCRSVLTRIDAMRTGELASTDRDEIHEHVGTCPSCNDSISDVEALAQSVKSLFAAPPRSCRDTVAGKCKDSYERLTEGGETVWVVFTDRGLRMIHRGGTLDEVRERYARRHGRELQEGRLPERFRKQLAAALGGQGVDDPQIDWSDDIEGLERDVMKTLTRIPRGEVRTYSWVAQQIGNPRAVRAVGNICARNVVPFVVPCHRVVPAAGGVGNYAFGPALKRELLRREGVDVDALDALAKKGVRFTGSKTTKIFCFPTCHYARRTREENTVPFRDAEAARAKGFRPCKKCQPSALSTTSSRSRSSARPH